TSYPAPGRDSFAVAPAAPHTVRLGTDINRDGNVTPLDVGALTPSLVRAAESGASCPPASAGEDVNGDGCFTVADLQTVAHSVSATPKKVSRLDAHASVVTSYTVNSNADGADAAANGICQTSTAGQCTLRAALTEANRAANAVSISF